MAKQPAAEEGTTPEEILLMSIGHEIINFRRGFPKSSLKHTFILSQYGSSMFGVKPQGEKVYLGIPKRFYERIKSAKWLYAAKVTGQPGLFLVMQMGIGSAKHAVGLRIFLRSKRLDALDEQIKSLRVVPMDRSGITRESDLLQGFNLKFVELERFRWEDDDENHFD